MENKPINTLLLVAAAAGAIGGWTFCALKGGIADKKIKAIQENFETLNGQRQEAFDAFKKEQQNELTKAQEEWGNKLAELMVRYEQACADNEDLATRILALEDRRIKINNKAPQVLLDEDESSVSYVRQSSSAKRRGSPDKKEAKSDRRLSPLDHHKDEDESSVSYVRQNSSSKRRGSPDKKEAKPDRRLSQLDYYNEEDETASKKRTRRLSAGTPSSHRLIYSSPEGGMKRSSTSQNVPSSSINAGPLKKPTASQLRKQKIIQQDSSEEESSS